ncbi:MAG: hypothetical protein AAF387_19195 [Pseudomonadota bacterium]
MTTHVAKTAVIVAALCQTHPAFSEQWTLTVDGEFPTTLLPPLVGTFNPGDQASMVLQIDTNAPLLSSFGSVNIYAIQSFNATLGNIDLDAGNATAQLRVVNGNRYQFEISSPTTLIAPDVSIIQFSFAIDSATTTNNDVPTELPIANTVGLAYEYFLEAPAQVLSVNAYGAPLITRTVPLVSWLFLGGLGGLLITVACKKTSSSVAS